MPRFFCRFTIWPNRSNYAIMFYMIKNNKKGFTLIEILVVVSIIGLLASVVLVGLGGIQAKGADARRIADLRQVQNGLELYYSKNFSYPTASCNDPTASGRNCWDANLKTPLINANIGIKNLANDPNSTQQSYMYGSNGSGYTLGAKLQSSNPPALTDDIDGSSNNIDCTGGSPETVYCAQF